MKIAQIAPLVESVPPPLYGGTERVVSWLTEELVAMGHQVTLFASGDSRTAAELEAVVPRGLRLSGIQNSIPYNMIMLDRVAARAHEFDVLHFHIDFFHYPLFRRMAHKTLTTLHGRQDLPELPDIYRAFPHMPLVSISAHQRKPVPPVRPYPPTTRPRRPGQTTRTMRTPKRTIRPPEMRSAERGMRNESPEPGRSVFNSAFRIPHSELESRVRVSVSLPPCRRL